LLSVCAVFRCIIYSHCVCNVQIDAAVSAARERAADLHARAAAASDVPVEAGADAPAAADAAPLAVDASDATSVAASDADSARAPPSADELEAIAERERTEADAADAAALAAQDTLAEKRQAVKQLTRQKSNSSK
jgi:hypothetical protein